MPRKQGGRVDRTARIAVVIVLAPFLVATPALGLKDWAAKPNRDQLEYLSVGW